MLRSDVILQPVSTNELPRTNITRERLRLAVNQDVLLERTLTVEATVAHVAHKRSELRVVR